MDAEFVRSKIFLDFDFKNGPSSVSVFNEARTKLKFLKQCLHYLQSWKLKLAQLHDLLHSNVD